MIKARVKNPTVNRYIKAKCKNMSQSNKQGQNQKYKQW